MQEYFRELNKRLGEAWNRFWFTPADVLAVCVLRVLAGGAALLYVLSFSQDLTTWFAADGLLPRETVLILNSPAGQTDGSANVVTGLRLSYFYLTDAPAMLWAMHAMGVAIVALFTAGVLSRVMNVLSLIVVLAYVHRAPMIAGHAEPLLAMLLLYLCLAPTGARLSFDRLWKKRRSAKASDVSEADEDDTRSWAANLSLRMIQVHLVMFCLMMGLTKLAGQSWWMGEAMWVLIAQSDSHLVDFTWLRGNTFIINAWTHAIVVLELMFPVLIWNRWTRPLVLAAALVVWLPLMMVTGLIGLYVVLIIACCAFLPVSLWRRMLPGDAAVDAATSMPAAA